MIVERFDPRANSIDPWITQVDSGFTAPLRATSEGALASSPTWSHDGCEDFYSSGYGTLRVIPASGGSEDAWPVGSHWPQAASTDGQMLLITRQGTTTGTDIMEIPLTGDHAPKPYLQTPFYENSARFSPDGRFVAYVSNSSGRREVHIQSHPQPGVPKQVSANGGEYPAWNEDGTELYFARNEPNGTRTLMVAQVTAGRPSTPQRVFEDWWDSGKANRTGFAVFDKGRRFLASVLVPVSAPQVMTVGHHWTAGLGTR